MSNISHVTGFYHFTTKGWKDIPRNIDSAPFIIQCAYGVANPHDYQAYVEKWEALKAQLPNEMKDVKLQTFMGLSKAEYEKCMTTEGFSVLEAIIKTRRPYGRISVFYVFDTLKKQIHLSFSFCSPEDSKIGKFSKKDGRDRAFKRFYGLDGEEIKRVTISLHHKSDEDPIFVISEYLLDLSRGDFSVESEHPDYTLSDDIARRVLMPGRKTNSVYEEVMVEGIVKIPNWITKFTGIE